MSEMHEVGCRKCGKGGYCWKVLTDGNGEFQARCFHCGHVSSFMIVTKSDAKKEGFEAFDFRMFV